MKEFYPFRGKKTKKKLVQVGTHTVQNYVADNRRCYRGFGIN